MTISSGIMGKKCVVVGLAMCFLILSIHEVSCQVDGRGSIDLSNLDISHRKNQATVQGKEVEEEESQSIKRQSESESSWKNTTVNDREKRSVSLSEENLEDSFDDDKPNQSEADNAHDEVSQRSSMMDEINREIEAHLKSLNKQAGSYGANKVGDRSTYAIEIDAQRRKQLEEIERQMEAGAARSFVVEEGTTQTKLETHDEIKFEGDHESVDNESGKHQTYYGKIGDDEKSETGQHVSSKKGDGGSDMFGSLGIAQSGMWRCFNQDKDGVKEEEVPSIVIPKYDINYIIKEESKSQGSASKTSSLIASLTQIIEKHRKEKWTPVVTTETSSTESSETVEKLKTTLKKYRAISARELVTRSDFEEILTTAARFEETSSASVSYISRLSMYRSLIKEGNKASQRAQLAQARAKLLKDIAIEKQKVVDSEFALVKALAERGDMLYVKIFAIKKLVLKLEAEKEEVDMNFQKIVGNLSRVLEEASQAYEEYHVVVRKWKEEQAAVELSREANEKAEVVWVQFLSTL